ncbi:hypothetical protein M4J06_003969 [Streptomyces coelicoflavus]|nr:hypothetical protein [Streptomyces coelicoflavus]MCQ4205277.1 hypothetical protein [Streptomyces coelicoflavus]
MRAFTKALVGATATVGIAAGGLATAGTAMATPGPQPRSEFWDFAGTHRC